MVRWLYSRGRGIDIDGTWCLREHGDTTLLQVVGLFQNHLKVNVTASDVAETRRLPKGRND